MKNGSALLAPFHLAPNAGIVLAVSGGVDSMVLLTLLAPLHGAQIRLTVAHFDHALRPTSQEEQALVVSYAQTLGVPVVTGQWVVADHPKVGLEAAARTARYRFLTQVVKETGAMALVTAHHADDQLETMLFRLARGGHLSGLAGIRADRRQFSTRVLRPLLAVPKTELRAYAQAHAVPSAEDASNASDAFSRNRLRQFVVPGLKRENPQAAVHANQFATDLQATLQLADQAMDGLLTRAQIREFTWNWRQLVPEPVAIQRLLVMRALKTADLTAPRSLIDQVLAVLQDGAGTRTFDLAANARVVVSYHRLALETQPEIPIDQAGFTLTPDAGWHAFENGVIGLFTALPVDSQRLVNLAAAAPVTIRHPRAGDVVRLANGHHQPVRRWLINTKVPQPDRAGWWLASQGAHVIWVQGMQPQQLFQARETGIIAAVLAFRPNPKK